MSALRTPTRPRVWDVTLTIAAGGALGAMARYGVATAWPHAPGAFPWATFGVNVLGCLLIGALMVVLTEIVGRPHRLTRPFLGVGILGGFTTFSTYAVEVDRLVAGGQLELALAYLFGTVAAALLAVQVGIVATRLATRALTLVLTRARTRKGTPA
ncbi:fluoride efflux transporter FluC [Pengzhenrongella frigida]|uniref:Fluoride-specific ion channel FluC n=1 Tax=Pengzhenrongella frigida TaxID=1259133 RepID=A0A4Q5MWY4_9MICO|nr:CrcB family protein [Cellulomonas sp. HLT2-17]RYV50110.1 CrcB family protein [Cellulomonas sp. HLT2-17]